MKRSPNIWETRPAVSGETPIHSMPIVAAKTSVVTGLGGNTKNKAIAMLRRTYSSPSMTCLG